MKLRKPRTYERLGYVPVPRTLVLVDARDYRAQARVVRAALKFYGASTADELKTAIDNMDKGLRALAR